MPTIERLEQALRNAHKAGDTAAAKRFAGEIRTMRTAPPSAHTPATPAAPARYEPTALDASVMAGGNALLGGFGDEIGAYFGIPIEAAIGAYTGEDDGKGLWRRLKDGYDRGLRSRRELMEYAQGEYPIASTVGTVAGGVAAGSAVSKAGLSMATNAAKAGGGLKRVAAGSAVDGAVMGGVYGAGEGEGVGKVTGAIKGVVAGGAMGLGAPYLAAGVGAAIQPIVAGVTARLRPGVYANRALGTALQRSGQTPDQVAGALEDATRDGQGMYTMADALGNSGQRMLSTVTRTPNDVRQAATEQLLKRQAGQGRRLQNTLEEGFGAPKTKAQTEAELTALRKAEANANYTAARNSTGSANPTGAIAKADEFLGANGSLPLTDIAPDSVAGVVARAKALLTDGDNVISDFETAFRAKVELDSMIDSANPTVRNQLKPIRDELDKALESASPNYANARDTFRRQSQDIEAADIGRGAAMRGRVEDTIPRFNALTRPEQQASFRAGYVDPYIETIQSTPGVMTNKARPLVSDATEAEFPAFAQPGKADQLRDRIAREQRMFETNTAALGGSRTADNLADMEDMASFDPAMIPRLLAGDFSGAAIAGVVKVLNESKGLPPRVLDQVGKALLETNPEAARRLLSAANSRSLNDQGRRRIAVTVLNSLAAPTAGRALANGKGGVPLQVTVTPGR